MAARNNCNPLGTTCLVGGEAANCNECSGGLVSPTLAHSGRSQNPKNIDPSATAPGCTQNAPCQLPLLASSPNEVPLTRVGSPAAVVQQDTPTKQENTALTNALSAPPLRTAQEESRMSPRQPRQRYLPILPERTGDGPLPHLRHVRRKQPLLIAANLHQFGAPVMVRLDLIRAAKANCGLSDAKIAELIGVTRKTVAAALRVDEGTNFYTFCAVMQVIGVELAELFPVRVKREVPERKQMVWSRGRHLAENPQQEMQKIEKRLAASSAGRRGGMTR
jgi:transcriptional regulator with XRE-family HTH domain